MQDSQASLPSAIFAKNQAPERLSELVLSAAKKHGARVALRLRKSGVLVQCTYAEMAERIEAIASGLVQAGIRPGDRVVLLSDNCLQWPIAYLGITHARGTVVPLDPGLPEASLHLLFDVSSPRLLVVSSSILSKLEANPAGPTTSIEDLVANPTNAIPTLASVDESAVDPDANEELASIIFTSGTSGRPKGVMLPHTGLIYAGRDCAWPLWELTDRDEMLMVLPLHHVYGFGAALIGGLLAGASLTFVEAIRGDIILAAINETHTTILPAIPRLLELFHDQILRQVRAKGPVAVSAFSAMGKSCKAIRSTTGVNLGPRLFKTVFDKFGGRLRRLVSAGAPLPIDVLTGMESLGFDLLEGYGLTETSAAATGCTFAQARAGKVGMALSGTEIRINNPNTSGDGEICIRGPGLMRGYFKNPELTAEVIRDGWFHTGDLGQLDNDGFVTILGRLDELIVTPAGKKASPFDVESHYREILAVKELAVLGMPSPSGVGELVHAAIVLDDSLLSEELTKEKLEAQIESAIMDRAPNVASHLRIQKVHFVGEIPKTTKMSVKRKDLRTLLLKGDGATQEPNAKESLDSLAEKVVAIVAEIAQAKRRNIPVRLRSSIQFDLGIDSLGKAELGAMIDKSFGIHLDAQLAGVSRVADLIHAVREAQPQEVDAAETDSRVETIPELRGGVSIAIAKGIGVAANTVWNLQAEGVENLPDGAFLLCPNHVSYLDGVWVASAMPHRRRVQMCSFGKRELWNHTITKALVTGLAAAIPVDRDGDAQPALRAGIEVLKSGRPLLVYPEGTRTKTGELGTFRRGAANMALASGAPLIPVRVDGSFDVFPPHRAFPKMMPNSKLKRQTMRVYFGAPIYPSASDTAQGLTERLEKAVMGLGRA